MRKRIAPVVIAALTAASLASGARTQTEPLTIYAAASLTDVFRSFDPNQRYSFAGSNTLETQIRNGAPADVFASAAPLNTPSGPPCCRITLRSGNWAPRWPRTSPPAISEQR